MKTCNKCGNTKPLADYTPQKAGKYGVHGTCKLCRAARSNAEYVRQPKKQLSRNRKSKYGMTPAEYDYLVAHQNGQCAICHKTPNYPLHVDHDHTTGNVRGLLCAGCNTAIGKLGDNTTLLYAAIQYLERPATEAQPWRAPFVADRVA